MVIKRITERDLAALKAKAQAHDDYLAALRMWRARMAWHTYREPDATGYTRAVADLATCIERVVAERIDREDHDKGR